MKIRLGSRGSSLALIQAQLIVGALKQKKPDLEIELIVIKTKGDKLINEPLWKIGDKGLFVEELQTALQTKKIDMAVHSVKDLPAAIPEDLFLAAFPPREDPSDVLVAKSNVTWKSLPQNVTIGTSSLRRQSQLLHHRPDLKIKMLRGNVDTRVRKLDDGEYFGIVLAAAGLARLGINRGERIPTDILLPSPGQGALAVEVRKEDKKLIEMASEINDPLTSVCVSAERAFLLHMEGGCQIPLGGLACLQGERLLLKGFLGDPDGSRVIYDQLEGNLDEATTLGKSLAKRIRTNGHLLIKVGQTEEGTRNPLWKP